MRPLQAHCYLGLGRLYERTGREPLARPALSTAVELYQAMGMLFWRSQAARRYWRKWSPQPSGQPENRLFPLRKESRMMPAAALYRFGLFRLDVVAGCLWRQVQLIPLPPKPLAVLAYLVAHAGQVVSKDTLLAAVWPEVVVTEGVLKTCLGRSDAPWGRRPSAATYRHGPPAWVSFHRAGDGHRANPSPGEESRATRLAHQGAAPRPAIDSLSSRTDGRTRNRAGTAAAVVVAGVAGLAAGGVCHG